MTELEKEIVNVLARAGVTYDQAEKTLVEVQKALTVLAKKGAVASLKS